MRPDFCTVSRLVWLVVKIAELLNAPRNRVPRWAVYAGLKETRKNPNSALINERGGPRSPPLFPVITIEVDHVLFTETARAHCNRRDVSIVQYDQAGMPVLWPMQFIVDSVFNIYGEV